MSLLRLVLSLLGCLTELGQKSGLPCVYKLEWGMLQRIEGECAPLFITIITIFLIIIIIII